VLSSSPTKRDAKHYLQTIGRSGSNESGGLRRGPSHGDKTQQLPGSAQSNPLYDGTQAVRESPRFIQGSRPEQGLAVNGLRHVAVVKCCDPQLVDNTTLESLAKTFAQLRALGLPSIIVTDFDFNDNDLKQDWLGKVMGQAWRIAAAVDKYGDPLTQVLDAALAVDSAKERIALAPFTTGRVFVDLHEQLSRALEEGSMVVVPSYAVSADQGEAMAVSANESVLAIIRYLSGLQPSPSHDVEHAVFPSQTRLASVDRIIVIDRLGGTPARERPDGAHVFLNLEDEFDRAKDEINAMARPLCHTPTKGSLERAKRRHQENLQLARDALAILPSTSSVLLTTPTEAANLKTPEKTRPSSDALDYAGTVGTRRTQNPLIHNLLTDRPVYSPSLPPGRIMPKASGLEPESSRWSKTTLIKRGMPVRIYPDPRLHPWVPPSPGAPRLRLTDTCIDLPRLAHLIEDSFNRKLDLDHYLNRVNQNLAGVIIAGEYEGGAVLTWERPAGLDEETAIASGRLVPYLDKFAVLKKSQGAGGVADIVFNAMARDCFPTGVCWRSRMNNPVNKWYFERSRGTWKLDGTTWAMFWTTRWGASGERTVRDYESVCRSVTPSWADNNIIPD